MSWRVAPAVLAIFRQADLQAPDRNDASDGTISSSRHRQQNPNSDHDPDGAGWVYAGDLTDDDASGIDCREIARQIVARKDRRVKYCLVPGTRVLCADLRWRPIEDLLPGDDLIGFDEYGPRPNTLKAHAGAKMRTSRVEAMERITRPCYRITTDRGVVTASADHLWLQSRAYLGKYRKWTAVEALRPGDLIQYFADPWESEVSFDAGWLAGIFDGEGCLSRSETHTSGWQLSAAQRSGPVFDRAVAIMSALKIDAAAYRNGNVMGLHVLGGLPGILRFLGTVPTTRLYAKAVGGRIWEGHGLPGSWPVARVSDVEYVGDMEVVGMQTSTRTLIAEGMLSHNCISEGRIVSSYSTSARRAWQWGPYNGPNGHFKHLHVSVRKEWRSDTSPWWAMPSTSIADDKEFVMASKEELEQVVEAAVLSITGGVRERDADGRVIDRDGRNVSNADVFTSIELLRAEVAALRNEVRG
jgi:hypothetical protein